MILSNSLYFSPVFSQDKLNLIKGRLHWTTVSILERLLMFSMRLKSQVSSHCWLCIDTDVQFKQAIKLSEVAGQW